MLNTDMADMNKRTSRIDLVKLLKYMIKNWWLFILCAAIGFGYMYWRSSQNKVSTYTASGTMYIYNNNPNLVNYGYASASDINSAVRLLDTYMVVVRSNKVLDVVAERLSKDYPGITPEYISGTLSMGSVSETGVVRVSCRTDQPQKSADICNAVMDVAPAEIIRVVSAGSIEIIDYATMPTRPDGRSYMRDYITGVLGGAVVAAGILLILFLLNHKVHDTQELKERYTLPVLASLRRIAEDNDDRSVFSINKDTPMDQVEEYAKLRMNLHYMLVEKNKHSVIVTSSISGEGKSTIAANLAISIAMSGKRVLLVDADMRRASQNAIFHYKRKTAGLSEVLAGLVNWQDCLVETHQKMLSVLPAGKTPPNPTELLDSSVMHALIPQLEQAYDMVIFDVPPTNIVADAFALSTQVAGALFIVRQGFSDHREIRKALIQAEMAGLELLGFVFYGEKLGYGGYYGYRGYHKYYYNKYYHRYDTRGDETYKKGSKGSKKKIPSNEIEQKKDEDSNVEPAAETA